MSAYLIFSWHVILFLVCFFFSSRRRHTRCLSDWSSDVCSSDLGQLRREEAFQPAHPLELRHAVGHPLLQRAVPVRQLGLLVLDLVVVGLDAQQQIGRASCRERG